VFGPGDGAPPPAGGPGNPAPRGPSAPGRVRPRGDILEHPPSGGPRPAVRRDRHRLPSGRGPSAPGVGAALAVDTALPSPCSDRPRRQPPRTATGRPPDGRSPTARRSSGRSTRRSPRPPAKCRTPSGWLPGPGLRTTPVKFHRYRSRARCEPPGHRPGGGTRVVGGSARPRERGGAAARRLWRPVGPAFRSTRAAADGAEPVRSGPSPDIPVDARRGGQCRARPPRTVRPVTSPAARWRGTGRAGRR
jgi:hypothetical protein